MKRNVPNDKKRTDTNRTDPETEFSAAERDLVAGLVEITNEQIQETDLTAYRAATILRATADCVERNGSSPTSVSYRLRQVLSEPGSTYLHAAVGSLDQQGEGL